ncbi:hypothetical protein [Rhodohalobacter sp.]|uniref:hypothetical protein n=1 Tax=Rhodohalobacter sp. TaxID=1974210 RepID=UPI002ACE0B95|nr:hypothetical protein [Rhodohalobacter sp.]MDZ7757183.1 hypothetical protein [Rhodohalobacter sp.]
MGNISGRFANPGDWEYLLSRFDEQGKLFWLYINQRCEISGVHQVHYPVDSAYLGFKVDNEFIQSFLQEINKDNQRLIRLEADAFGLLNMLDSSKNQRAVLYRKNPALTSKLSEN